MCGQPRGGLEILYREHPVLSLWLYALYKNESFLPSCCGIRKVFMSKFLHFMNDPLKVSNLVFLMISQKSLIKIIAMQLLVQKKYMHWFHTCFDAIKFDIFILRHSGSLILMPPIYNAQNSLWVTLRTKIDGILVYIWLF